MRSARDWRTAVSTPLTYRIGSSTVRFQTHMIVIVTIICIAVLFLFYVTGVGRKNKTNFVMHDSYRDHDHLHEKMYNSTYPLSKPVRTDGGVRYLIAVISDLDQNSKDPRNKNKWVSYLKFGHLTISDAGDRVNVQFRDNVTLSSNLAAGGRGMELSELTVFNGGLYTLDDRTGVIYQIIGDRVVPWVIMADGPGGESKGFKAEWSCVKDQHLYVGGLGKEWTTSDGEVLNTHPMYIKKISMRGEVTHIDWHDQYVAVRKAAGVTSSVGYMIHEAVGWSNEMERWVFLPRRMSNERYNDVIDEKKGTNVMITADDDFRDIKVSKVGNLIPTHGFSSFKFIPGTKESVIVALKSEEVEGTVASYVTVFNVDGTILWPEYSTVNIEDCHITCHSSLNFFRFKCNYHRFLCTRNEFKTRESMRGNQISNFGYFNITEIVVSSYHNISTFLLINYIVISFIAHPSW